MNLRLRTILLAFLKTFQVTALNVSYGFFKFFPKSPKQWVVCPDELAGVLQGVASALPSSYSVNLSKVGLRQNASSFMLREGRFHELRRLIVGPVLLGYLANQSNQFFYIWNRGFLHERSSDFSFLARRGARIAIMFCGDDIRSPALHKQLCDELQRDSFVNYDMYLSPVGGLKQYELKQKETAHIADRFATVIFNAPNCQSSYLNRSSGKLEVAHGFVSVSDSGFCHSVSKFDNLNVVKIIHAPSSTAVKGTSMVRAAILRLQHERDDFTYTELHNKPHDEVLALLQGSHICLNQFLSFGTGVLGIEAMAARCATLMSADPTLEPSIPPVDEGQTPWVITQSWEIYENLKTLLDDKERLCSVANDGFKYAATNYSFEAAGKRLRTSLAEYNFDVSETH